MDDYNNGYNDDLYMDEENVNFQVLPDGPQKPQKAGGSGKKSKHKFLRGALAVVLALGLMAGISVGSIMGYVWYTDKNGATGGTTVSGGQKVIYTLSKSDGALTSQEIYVKASPWVVAITSQSRTQFGMATSSGTGIIMSDDGYIITNHHVIDGATTVTVTLGDDKEYEATVVGSEAKSDIAVLKIDATGLEAAEFGQSSELVTGDAAIVIGNPLGLDFADTMTQGIISSTEREVQIDQYIMTLIQIDASVNPGNSGGPLINSRGQVVGVVNAKIAEDNVEGIGFAIPIDSALDIANDLIKYGYVTNRPMLGITVQSITAEQAQFYGYEAGITVTDITAGSCAEAGGMKVGDKILSFNGVEVSDAAELNYQKDKCSIGDTVTVTVERNGEKLDLSITLTGGSAA